MTSESEKKSGISRLLEIEEKRKTHFITREKNVTGTIYWEYGKQNFEFDSHVSFHP